MHARQQILNAVAALLDAAASPPWNGVYVSAILPGTASLPAVLVRQQAEQVEDGTIHSLDLYRTLSMSVLFAARARAKPEDNTTAMNAAASAIESVLTASALIASGVGVKSLALQGSEIDEEPDESGYVVINLEYSIEYVTPTGSPDTLA